MPNVLCVIGTRPEAIKMAPVVKALRTSGLPVRLLLTGQHRSLLDRALEDFDLHGDVDLDLMRPNQRLSELTARLFDGLDSVLERECPDLLLAQGDTTTVMVASMVAFYRNIPFGHVEAGLRTGNLRYPFPEELNRIVAGRVATLNFAPTEGAREALLHEGVAPETIHVTGNTVIDALLSIAAEACNPSIELSSASRVILMTLHRRENFGLPAVEVFSAVCDLCARFQDLHFVYPVHPNPNIQSAAQAALGIHPRVHLLEPLDYRDLVAVMQRADLVLTDSGGLQEEAPALGKPVLVLRNETERPEAVIMGVARLVGTSRARIVSEVTRLLEEPGAYSAMARGVSPYGDGHAAERIASIVGNFVLRDSSAQGELKPSIAKLRACSLAEASSGSI